VPRHAASLPVEATSFVGREAELALVERLLPGSRMMTLTGVGGVGKTRLALRVAATLGSDFPDGVVFTELSALQETDADLLPLNVAAALVVQDQTTRPMIDVLADQLAAKRLLLVLDTCERLVDACGQLCTVLLRAAPGLRILATSRQPLGLPDERIVMVPPLAVSEPVSTNGRPPTSDAMTLFAERAAALLPEFTITGDNARTVAQLCRLLDGIPLALELAAVRLQTLSLDQIVARLDDRFDLLTDDRQNAPRRHQTLRAAVGWSHELCEPAERLLWSRLSVFPGEFDLAAVEQVCADEHIPAEHIVTLLERLVDKSIVLTEHRPTGTRYHLLDTLRDYGREWLRALGEEEHRRRQHRDYYLRLAEEGEAAWFSPHQAETFARTEPEHANLRAALDFCLTAPDEVRTGLKLAGTLWFYWVGCGYLGEGRLWLDRALALDQQPSDERAKALWVNGYVTILQGDNATAVRLLTECRRQARRTGDQRALAYSVHRLGCAALMADDHACAAAYFEDALDRYESLGELNSNVVMARIELGMAVAFQGDLARAESLCEQARATCEQHGEQWTLAYAYYVLSFTAWAGGDLDKAIGLARDCLRINHAFHDMVGTVIPVELLALYAAVQGAHTDAALLQGAAQGIWRVTGLPLFGSKYFNAPHEQCEALIRTSIGDDAYDTAFRRGTKLGLDETVAYALADL
jgi:predicted ATPase